MGPAKVPEPMQIALSDAEENLYKLLDECAKDLREKGTETECRIAGGWVRDKLLGLQSHDVDVALSGMMGVPFAHALVAFAESKGIDAKEVATVASNPDQSKHLETAKTTIFGIELDLVNLRSEEYAENSRIPTEVKFGTPLEDAMRRDMTINALFYNVHSREVEDCTQKGIPDLKNGIVRTPLPPRETFQDDPLRVLRCIRFASRFGFTMVDELAEAARRPEIQTALAQKISRERVGEEIDKMIKGRNPLRAIQLINQLALHPSIFSVPESIRSTFSAEPTAWETSLTAATLLSSFLSPPEPSSSSPPPPTWLAHAPLPPIHPILLSNIHADPSAAYRLFLGAALLPYKGITYLEANKANSKKKVKPAVEAAIRDGLKLGSQNHYLDGVPALFGALELLRDPSVERLVAGEGEDGNKRSARVAVGLLLRERTVHYPISGSHWATSLLFSLLDELVSIRHSDSDTGAFEAKAREKVEQYNGFARTIEELQLDAAVDAKPILDGRQVIQTLGAKSGPWLAPVIQRMVEWQLEFPRGSEAECVTWLQGEKAAGRIDFTTGPLLASKRLSPEVEGGGKRKKTKQNNLGVANAA